MGKTCRINVRVEPEDKEYLMMQEKECGINESEYVRRLIQSAKAGCTATFQRKEDYQAMRELIREINHVGNNINQIVKP